MSPARRPRRWRLVGVLLLALPLVVPAVARAHWADLAVAEIAVRSDGATVILTLPSGLLAEFDGDGDGRLSVAEVEDRRGELERVLARGFGLGEEAGAELGPSVAPAVAEVAAPGAGPDTHTTLELSYRFARPPERLRIDYRLFLPGVDSASLLATLSYRGTLRTFVFTPGNHVWRLGPRREGFAVRTASFVMLGVRHIATGYDHLLFLLTLLVLGGGLRYLAALISAFTVAHALTLTLALVGAVALPPRLVEAAIALSIAFVAAENLWRDPPRARRDRPRLTFAFGLIHGLGFAGALQAAVPSRDALLPALVGFNAGVELGGVGVVAVASLLLLALRGWRREPLLRRTVSLVAGLAGLLWFVERVLTPL